MNFLNLTNLFQIKTRYRKLKHQLISKTFTRNTAPQGNIFFQIRKCNNLSCVHHKPLRGDEEIDIFPDPVPQETDGVLHYTPGSGPSEKFLPSTLENVEKSPHNVPFSPTAQTAKNVRFVISCSECKKPRFLHSRNKVKKDDVNAVKRMMGKITYVCGAALSEYLGTGGDKDERFINSIFARENISCTSKIELPYYSVDHLPKICIHCGVGGTSRTLSNSVEHYPSASTATTNLLLCDRNERRLWRVTLRQKKKKTTLYLYTTILFVLLCYHMFMFLIVFAYCYV